MTLAEAEEMLKELKRQGPIKEEWVICTDEGITFSILPMGCAEGSVGLGAVLTVIPRYAHSALFHGVGRPHRIEVSTRMSAHHLWPQEQWVYELERTNALTTAMRELNRIFPLPRIGEWVDGKFVSSVGLDMKPYPEDFGSFPKKPKNNENSL